MNNQKMQQKMLAKAMMIASTAHVNDLDQGGNAYILHAIRVMNGLAFKDPELMQIAILHDVVEDCPAWTIDALRAEGFSERVLRGLSYMTKTKEDTSLGDEGYFCYVRRMFECLDAMLVKVSDLKDNSDLTRMKGTRQKDFARTFKYMQAFAMLRDELQSKYPEISIF